MKMVSPHKGWVLLNPSKKSIKGKIKLASASTKDEKKDPSNWLKAVEQMCTLQIGRSLRLSNLDEEAMTTLQAPPPGWNLEADEELAQFLIEYVVNVDITQGGGVQGSEHFTRIQVGLYIGIELRFTCLFRVSTLIEDFFSCLNLHRLPQMTRLLRS